MVRLRPVKTTIGGSSPSPPDFYGSYRLINVQSRTMITIAKNIKTLRTQRGLSQRNLATSIGTTAAAICLLENGARYPSLPTMIRLSDVFGTSIDSLVFGITKTGRVNEKLKSNSKSVGRGKKSKN